MQMDGLIVFSITANGVYDFQDFEAAPQRYCGMTISSQAYTPGVDDADTSALANLTRSCR